MHRPYVLGATTNDARAFIAENPDYADAGIVTHAARRSAFGLVDVAVPLVMTAEFNALIAKGDSGALELERIMKRNAVKRRDR